VRTRKRKTVHLIKAVANYLLFTYRMALFGTTEKRLSLIESIVSDDSLQRNEVGGQILIKLNKVPPELKSFVYEKVKGLLSGNKMIIGRKERKKWRTFEHKKTNESESETEKAENKKGVTKNGKKTKQIVKKTPVPPLPIIAVVDHDRKA